MAHELAHVYTPKLTGKNEGEDYADAFAGALLFPKACAEPAYNEAIQAGDATAIIRVLHKYVSEHIISLNTVYQQINSYAISAGLPELPITEKSIHTVRNTIKGPLVSEALFDPMPPEPKRYIAACEQAFLSDFFIALKRMINENGMGASYIQQVLDVSIKDAFAIHEELRH